MTAAIAPNSRSLSSRSARIRSLTDGILRPQISLHGPERGAVAGAKLGSRDLDPGAHPRIGIGPIALPPPHHRLHQPEKARPVALEVDAERAVEQHLRFVPGDCRVLEVELELAVGVRQVDVREQPPFCRDLRVQTGCPASACRA